MTTLRIFISSPGDVAEERFRAHLVIQKLAREYTRFFKLEALLWEYEPMLASGHFQDAISPPSSADIVVLILWSRLGTPLPAKTAVREYRGADGRVPVTGTEWEFEEALESARRTGAPDLLVYRRTGDPGTSLTNAEMRAEQEQQWTRLQEFWRRNFEDQGIFLAGNTKYQLVSEFDEKLERDLKALLDRRVAAQPGVPVTWTQGSPFRGLASYDVGDAGIFFGRDGPVKKALTSLIVAADSGSAFLLLLGASGVGKSSLARAGLIPALLAPKAIPGVGLWRYVIFRPGDGAADPILGLATALLTTKKESPQLGLPELVADGLTIADLAGHLRSAPADCSFIFRSALLRIAEAARARNGMLPHEEARLVLLVDQLEELVTHAHITDEDRTIYIALLRGLAKTGLVWIVATMRSDLWHRASEIPGLLDAAESGSRMDIKPPDRAEILEMVRQPAAAAGITFETHADTGLQLDGVIVNDASSEPGVLPLLSVLLETLYQRDVLNAPLNSGPAKFAFSTYEAVGELKGSIAARAEEVFHSVEAEDAEAARALPGLLRSLVTISPGGTMSGRPAPLAIFINGGPAHRLINYMIAPDARLLTAVDNGAGPEIRLAHEALLSQWPRAAAQLAADQRDFETKARLEAMLSNYQTAEPRHKNAALLQGLTLSQGIDLCRRWRIDPASSLGSFVVASNRQAQKGQRLSSYLVIFAFAIFGVITLYSWRQSISAETAALDVSIQTAHKSAELARTELENGDELSALINITEVIDTKGKYLAKRAVEPIARSLLWNSHLIETMETRTLAQTKDYYLNAKQYSLELVNRATGVVVGKRALRVESAVMNATRALLKIESEKYPRLSILLDLPSMEVVLFAEANCAFSDSMQFVLCTDERYLGRSSVYSAIDGAGDALPGESGSSELRISSDDKTIARWNDGSFELFSIADQEKPFAEIAIHGRSEYLDLFQEQSLVKPVDFWFLSATHLAYVMGSGEIGIIDTANQTEIDLRTASPPHKSDEPRRWDSLVQLSRSKDGSVVAVLDRGDISVFKLEPGSKPTLLKKFPGDTTSVKVSPSGTLLAFPVTGQILRLVSLKENGFDWHLPSHVRNASNVQISPDDQVLVQKDGQGTFWVLDLNAQPAPFPIKHWGPDPVLHFGEEGTVFTSSKSLLSYHPGKTMIWAIRPPFTNPMVRNRKELLPWLGFHLDDRTGQVYKGDVPLVSPFQSGAGKISYVTSRRAPVVILHSNDEAKFIDLSSGHMKSEFHCNGSVGNPVPSHVGDEMVIQCAGKIALIRGRDVVRTIDNEGDSRESAVFSENGKYVFIPLESGLEIWSVDSGEVVNKSDERLFTVTRAKEDSFIVLLSNRDIEIWRPHRSPEKLGETLPESIYPWGMWSKNPAGKISSDGVVARSRSTELQVYYLSTLARTLRGWGTIRHLDFSIDGKYLSVVREDQGLELWRIFPLELLGQTPGRFFQSFIDSKSSKVYAFGEDGSYRSLPIMDDESSIETEFCGRVSKLFSRPASQCVVGAEK